MARLARLGFLADLLSKPVLVGYMAGIAVLMIVSQLEKVTGVPVSGDTVVAQLASFVRGLDELHPATTLLAAGVLALLLIVQRRFPRAPAPLIGIRASPRRPSPRSSLARPGDPGSSGTIAGRLPAVGLARRRAHRPGRPARLRRSALMIVGYVDNVLTARAFATRNGYRIDANQELLALGMSNLAAGVDQGFPVSSSGSRTVIGDALGSRSQLHSLVALASIVAGAAVPAARSSRRSRPPRWAPSSSTPRCG